MVRRREQRRGRRPRRGVLLALLVIVALADSATLAGAAVLHARRLERAGGTNVVTAPELVAERRNGPFAATIDYAALFSADGHQVSSQVSWDDDWFFDDPASYNHELAHACAVLSAVANAESAYYQQGSEVPAYAEHALAELGFEEVSTASYRYRSEVVDELLGVLDDTDVVAYAVATKHVRNSRTGEEKLLTLVAVRGSYGSEWLSNIRIEGSDASLGGDHLGFTLAADEIVADLEARALEVDPSVERTYLFCGHSRGAAVANLLASYAFDGSGRAPALERAESVRAYTFATPNCTSDAAARDERYASIFNVLNPADVVPMLPPATWGYDRYGRDVVLPALDDAGAADAAAAMRASYRKTMGVESACEPGDRAMARELVADVCERFGSLDELVSPAGLVDLAGACLKVDLTRLLANHFPNTYIAWLEATTPADLTLT